MAQGLSDWLGKSDKTINLDNVTPNGPFKTLTLTLTQAEMDWARSPTPFRFTPNWYITRAAKALAKQKCQMALTTDVSHDIDQRYPWRSSNHTRGTISSSLAGPPTGLMPGPTMTRSTPGPATTPFATALAVMRSGAVVAMT